MHPIPGEAVQPQQPIAADSLAIQADVVIEDQAVAPVYPPLPKSRLDLVAAWDEPLSFRRPGLRRVAS